MSAPVDVLAVVRRIANGGDLPAHDGHDLNEAADAIAELIEADKEFDAALLDEANAEQADDDELYCNALNRLQWAEDRRRAALRAVGGAE